MEFAYTDAEMIDQSERIRLATEAQLNAHNEGDTLPDAPAPTLEDVAMEDHIPIDASNSQLWPPQQVASLMVTLQSPWLGYFNHGTESVILKTRE